MKINNILSSYSTYFVFAVCTLIVISSCEKKEIVSFTTPSTYRFNSPTLIDKAFYVLDRSDTTYKKVTDTLKTFLVDNEDLADSINNRFKAIFASESVIAFEFLTSNEVNIQYAVFDSIYINKRSEKSAYRFEGNEIKIDALPNIKLSIDNFFLELRQCYHAADRLSYRRATQQDTTFTRNYDVRPCSFTTDREYINNMQLNVGLIDTVAVYQIDVVFSKY